MSLSSLPFVTVSHFSSRVSSHDSLKLDGFLSTTQMGGSIKERKDTVESPLPVTWLLSRSVVNHFPLLCWGWGVCDTGLQVVK